MRRLGTGPIQPEAVHRVGRLWAYANGHSGFWGWLMIASRQARTLSRRALLDVLDLTYEGSTTIQVASPTEATGDLGVSSGEVFTGRSQPQPHGRVFGGQVLAQCVIAAGRTVAPVTRTEHKLVTPANAFVVYPPIDIN